MEYRVKVIASVQVVVDASAFDDIFMREFREFFYDFHSIEDHVKHLAQLYTRSICDESSTFIEGYGNPKKMGIKFKPAGRSEVIL